MCQCETADTQPGRQRLQQSAHLCLSIIIIINREPAVALISSQLTKRIDGVSQPSTLMRTTETWAYLLEILRTGTCSSPCNKLLLFPLHTIDCFPCLFSTTAVAWLGFPVVPLQSACSESSLICLSNNICIVWKYVTSCTIALSVWHSWLSLSAC